MVSEMAASDGPLHFEAVEELGRKVLAVGCGAAIAAREYFPVAPQTLHHALGRIGNRSGKRVHALQFEVSAF